MNFGNVCWLHSVADPPPSGFRLVGCGVRERMPCGVVRHRWNPRIRLLIYFHTPADIRLPDGSTATADRAFYLWPPEGEHRYGATARDWVHSWFVFSCVDVPGPTDRRDIPAGAVLPFADEPTVTETAGMLCRDLCAGAPGGREADRLLLESMLCRLRAALNAGPETIPGPVRRAERYMQEHFPEESLGVPELARAAALSVPHFRTRFRECYGVPPAAYLLRVRMAAAVRLLECGAFSCKEVATRTGFADPLYFSRVFRKYYGKSPSRFLPEKNAVRNPDGVETVSVSV